MIKIFENYQGCCCLLLEKANNLSRHKLSVYSMGKQAASIYISISRHNRDTVLHISRECLRIEKHLLSAEARGIRRREKLFLKGDRIVFLGGASSQFSLTYLSKTAVARIYHLLFGCYLLNYA